MKRYLPQKFANSCGLACISYIVGLSEMRLVIENQDILSKDKLQFIGLYCYEIVQILNRYQKEWNFDTYKPNYREMSHQFGVIVYIEQINHYLVRLEHGWGDPYMTLRGIPTFGIRDTLPYEPTYIIYQGQYH